MDRRQRFRWGLIILLLAPFVVLAGFAAYVYLANAQPQLGELRTGVSPQVVMPWGESAYYITYDGYRPPPPSAVTPTPTPAAPPPVDIAFMVDESGSMISTIGEMAKAARGVAQELAKGRPGRIRFAAIRFDTGAEIETDWTASPAKLYEGLDHIAQTAKAGGNDSAEAFKKLDELLSRARPGATKVVIFYTDGVIADCGPMCRPMSPDEIKEAARKLREEQQVELYSVGLPGIGSDPLMIEVTGDSSHIKDPSNARELASLFAEFKVFEAPTPPTLPTSRDSTGQLSHRLDGRHFSAPLQGTNWKLSSGALNLPIKPVPEAPTTYAHPLVPLSAGLWRVGIEPPRLSFFDKDGRPHTVAAQRRPLLLKVTWFVLLLMFLPALLWWVAHLQRRPRQIPVEQKEVALPDIPKESLPTPLPVLPRLTIERLAPIPTLFIGVGGAGRRALHAVRSDLKQAHLGHAGEPYRFLWIDADTKETERESPFEDWEGYRIEALVAPPAVRQVEGYLPEPTRSPEHLQWFNAYLYREGSGERLNLSDGAKGDRALARLALFRWLSAPNAIFPALAEQVKQLLALRSDDGTRQIVVFASSDGGVGSGWFLDFGRLFQRLARQQQSQGLDALPEILGVLCDDPERRHPENRRALAMEVETSMTAGKFPQRVTYVPGEALLDQVDSQSPYHWVFATAANDRNSVAAQCGELASVLVERYPRTSLLDQARTARPNAPIMATTCSAHVLPTLIYDQVRCDLFLRLLGPEILLDVEPDVQGGLRPKAVAGDLASQHLDDWSRAEAAGSPLQLLLLAAVSPSSIPGFVNWVQATSFAPREWFGQAFSAAVTQRLQGRSVPGATGWQRDWMPGEAIAALRLLAARLERNVKPELRARNAPAQATEVVDHVTGLANSAADGLEQWMLDFCRACEQAAAVRSRLEQARRNLIRLQGRVYLDLETKPDQIERWARAGLESWLGTPDTVSAIRQRLFFSVTADGERAQVSVRSFVAEPQNFTHAEEVAKTVDHLSRTLALQVPAMRIGGVLANLSEDRRRAVARELVRTETQPRQVLLVSPQTTGLGTEEQHAVEAFGRSIPNPPSHGPRSQQTGDDHSAIRRLELTEAVADESIPAGRQMTFVEMTESIAEAVRRRAEKKYQIALPIFPPRLRIALAHPSAFRSFARAYKGGHVVRRQDESGRDQWFFVDTDQFLTFGQEQSLAHAAANYVRDVANHQESFAISGDGGSFSRLEQWRSQRTAPDDDTLAQIAVDVYEQ